MSRPGGCGVLSSPADGQTRDIRSGSRGLGGFTQEATRQLRIDKARMASACPQDAWRGSCPFVTPPAGLAAGPGDRSSGRPVRYRHGVTDPRGDPDMDRARSDEQLEPCGQLVRVRCAGCGRYRRVRRHERQDRHHERQRHGGWPRRECRLHGHDHSGSRRDGHCGCSRSQPGGRDLHRRGPRRSQSTDPSRWLAGRSRPRPGR